jgi:hypothetical protein
MHDWRFYGKRWVSRVPTFGAAAQSGAVTSWWRGGCTTGAFMGSAGSVVSPPLEPRRRAMPSRLGGAAGARLASLV